MRELLSQLWSGKRDMVLVALMIGRKVTEAYPPALPRPAAARLRPARLRAAG